VTPYARAVLDTVDQVPAGFALTYGDVAELMGTGSARTVGMVLSRWGAEAPWWRIVQAAGTLAPQLAERGLSRLRAEGCPLVGDRVDLALARWPGP
jgi:alkylated DNA nucleotide flippase Atl1